MHLGITPIRIHSGIRNTWISNSKMSILFWKKRNFIFHTIKQLLKSSIHKEDFSIQVGHG